jgi:tetrahydromethanopterin S-methyltransferase subunit C
MVMLILLSVLPVFAAWLWLKRKVNIKPLYFLAALGAGILSLALAAVLQILLPAIEFGVTREKQLMFLARSALIEEGGRLVALLLFLGVAGIFNRGNARTTDMTTATGMIAGLAFAAVETASFAAIAGTNGLERLLRLSAVLLHAACGIRCALAASALLSKKNSFLLDFARAAALHTVYNFITLHDGARYYILGLLLVFSSFISSLRFMNRTDSGE